MTNHLPRPYIDLATRCSVILRQLGKEDADNCVDLQKRRRKLRWLLRLKREELARQLQCGIYDLRLDHDPPLGARQKKRNTAGEVIGYIPDANDPNFLVYRPHGAQFEGSHYVKTYVRGEHGQYCDTTLIKRQRRRERDESIKPKRKIQSRPFPAGKRPWPGRPFLVQR